jgi:hypothetical protein
LICVCASAENGITVIATSVSQTIKVCLLNIDSLPPLPIAICQLETGNSSFSGSDAPKRNANTAAKDRFHFVNIA